MLSQRLSFRVLLITASAIAMFAAQPSQAKRWIDVKTGKAVASLPVITNPQSGEADWIRPDPTDPKRAHDPRTGRTFAWGAGQPQNTSTTAPPPPPTPSTATAPPPPPPPAQPVNDARPIDAVTSARISHLNDDEVRVQVACRIDAPPRRTEENGSFERVEGLLLDERPTAPGGVQAIAELERRVADARRRRDSAPNSRQAESEFRAASDALSAARVRMRADQCDPPSEIVPAPVLDKGSARLLDEHNKARAEVGSPPLQWRPQLAATATAYARQLASGIPYAHAARADRDNARENLSMGRLGETPVQMMRIWLREKDNFISGIFPNVSRTGDWSRVGHYSQMIWGTTTHVGCGAATGAKWKYLVCRYSPPGNQDGKPVLAIQTTRVAN